MGRHPIEAAREAKFAKRRKGIVAYNQQAREIYGVSLPALVRKPDEHRAAMLRVGCRRMPSVVIANAATGKLVPHQQMREAVRTNRAPHPRPNPQARPVAAARKFLSRTAVPLPRASAVYGQRRMAAGRVVVSIAEAGAKLPREREDHTAEYAVLQLKKEGGCVFLVPAPEDEERPEVLSQEVLAQRASAWQKGSGGDPCARPLAFLRLAGPSELQARARELDVVGIFSLPVPKRWAEEACTAMHTLDEHLNDFHQKHHAADPFCSQMQTVELGWSGFPGGKRGSGSLQAVAQEQGLPFPLKAWLTEEGKLFDTVFLSVLLPRMWQVALHEYPVACAEMCDKTKFKEWGLHGTGWNKVTLGINCPTPLHYDDKNYGVTALFVVGLSNLEGGEHVLFGSALGEMVVVQTCEWGTLIVGDYTRVLHGNMSTVSGARMLINAYCSSNTVDRLCK